MCILKIYETQRLILRQIDESWAEEVLQYYNRNRFFLSEWEPQRPEEFYTLDFQKKFLQEDFKSNENGTIFRLWITNKNDEQKIIGCITFNLIVRGVLQSCILGYKLDKEEINKGLITEGIKKAIITKSFFSLVEMFKIFVQFCMIKRGNYCTKQISQYFINFSSAR